MTAKKMAKALSTMAGQREFAFRFHHILTFPSRC